MTRADDGILTVDDLAALLACDRETAAARLTSGDLPGVKVGRSWIIPRQALFERLNEKAREEAANRRLKLENAQQKAASMGQDLDNVIQTVAPSTSATLTSLENTRGRKRRVPPALPTLKI